MAADTRPVTHGAPTSPASATAGLDAFLQSPGQLEMLAEAPLRLPTEAGRLAAQWRQDEDENHCTFCAKHCLRGIVCFGIPCLCLPCNMHKRCTTINHNLEQFSQLSRTAEVTIDNEAVTISYKVLERDEVCSRPQCLRLGPVARKVTGAADKVYRVPLGSIADVNFGHFREVNKYDPGEGFSWWTGYYRLNEAGSGPMHLMPFCPEHSGPFPDGFTAITPGPVTMEEKCCEGEKVGTEGETLFKMYRVNHDIVFLSNLAKSRKAILLAAQMKRSEAAWWRFWNGSSEAQEIS